MRHLLPLTLLATLSIAAPAGAQAIATATPPKAGGATKLHFEIDGLQDPVSQRIPSALTFTVPAGFTFDRRAVSRALQPPERDPQRVPRGSAIGTGTLLIGVTLPEGARDATIPLHAYMSTGNRIWMIAYVTGWRVVPGTILARPTACRSCSIRCRPRRRSRTSPTRSSASRSTSGTRVIKKVVRSGKRKRGSKTRKARVTKTRVDLIHAPAQCADNWPASINATFPDGSALPLPAPMPCVP